MIWKVWVQKD